MRYLKNGLTITIQVILLTMIYLAGVFIEKETHIPIPGNVLGMMLLFVLLEIGIVPATVIDRGADFLLRHLTLLFIPVVAGLIPWGNFILRNGLPLTAAILLSGFVALAVTGILADKVLNKDEAKEGKQC